MLFESSIEFCKASNLKECILFWLVNGNGKSVFFLHKKKDFDLDYLLDFIFISTPSGEIFSLKVFSLFTSSHCQEADWFC